MFVRSRCLIALAWCGMSLAQGGCCSRCESRCTPQGPWQSPTTQAMRALMVVNTEELHILRIDGRNVQPSCIGTGGVREYYIPAGTHTVTASFRYAARVSSGLIGAVYGTPVTVQRHFAVGHEYVPVYREHVRSDDDPEDRYWSLEIVDLDEADPDPEPEVKEARLYCATIHNWVVAADHPTPTFPN